MGGLRPEGERGRVDEARVAAVSSVIMEFKIVPFFDDALGSLVLGGKLLEV
jgi:hypothetical protein